MKRPAVNLQSRMKASGKTRIKNSESLLMNSWWVILFMLGCYLLYEQGLKKRESDFAKLNHQFLDLQKEKMQVTAQRDGLLRQINSQSDPEWVEMALMKGLGLVPEGQIKVLFTEQKELLER